MKFRTGILIVASVLMLKPVDASADVLFGPCVQNVRKSQVTITWVTEKEETTAVEYGTTETESVVETVSFPGRRLFHEVTLKGLRPGTRYLYRIAEPETPEPESQWVLLQKPKPGKKSDDKKTSTDAKSISDPAKSAGVADSDTGKKDSKVVTEFSFRTAPADKNESFRFIIYGDTRSDRAAHEKVLELVEKLRPDFVVHTGDIIGSGNKLDDWKDFFQAGRVLLGNVPYYFAIGNHERDHEYFYDFFALPGNERYYSFDWGNAHFVCLDSASPYLWDRRQIEWLERDLKANRRADFTVVALHHPPYSVASHGSEMFVRETYCPIFKKYGVDLVVAGHDHSYQHSVADGIHYVVAGGGGAPLYDFGMKRPYLVRAESVLHVVLAEVDGRTMTLKAYVPVAGGAVFDTITLRAED